MGVTNTTTVLNVADHELGVAWHSDLFGREPDASDDSKRDSTASET